MNELRPAAHFEYGELQSRRTTTAAHLAHGSLRSAFASRVSSLQPVTLVADGHPILIGCLYTRIDRFDVIGH